MLCLCCVQMYICNGMIAWVSELLVFVSLLCFCTGDMPISNEQWRVAVGLWVSCIQRTLIIRRGVKRSPSSLQGAPSPLSQSHSIGKKCITKKKGRKKAINDSLGGLAITTGEFYDGLIALATIVSCRRRNECKDSLYRNLVGPLLELLGGNGLGVLVVIAILLLRSGDVETNPGPVERGGWLYLVNSLYLSCALIVQ